MVGIVRFLSDALDRPIARHPGTDSQIGALPARRRAHACRRREACRGSQGTRRAGAPSAGRRRASATAPRPSASAAATRALSLRASRRRLPSAASPPRPPSQQTLSARAPHAAPLPSPTDCAERRRHTPPVAARRTRPPRSGRLPHKDLHMGSLASLRCQCNVPLLLPCFIRHLGAKAAGCARAE